LFTNISIQDVSLFFFFPNVCLLNEDAGCILLLSKGKQDWQDEDTGQTPAIKK